MVIWLNGPFGVGKTTVARALQGQAADAVVADPERVGYVIRRTFWRGRDYQDVALWRRLTIRQVQRAGRRGTAIVPMTIVDRDVFDQVTNGAIVFALVAQRATIEARIAGSAEAQQWRTDNLDRCLAAFSSDAFGLRIPTDDRSPEAIAEEILGRL